ncbi:bifunctional salicylyl-CoA 5-hydroxylase/oxidoreductase [Chondromyces apiculatus]|uniref:Anthraniloyl-CoA monooxygenase n=1 Tax=Chondromyces apiculatus DSM 436 TaxID=1192034 RepID=A0A017T8C6_9BACT|nr:bifunctional salicylyl-CoA 5-hydroxylase/oxidoreductase [Chondromyces apiculatus]EYF04861.1 Anthraniloyl-CoA monooxygenase [Chondromyces apiculatus DSM 436]
MRIVCIGGGPAGLYFALLMKKARPDSTITVLERNRADDTFGFGVVFSDATLENLAEADLPSYQAITRQFTHWDDIDIQYRGQMLRSTGHGFSGLSRQTLLAILQERARGLGVDLHFEQEIPPDATLPGVDLLVVADGVNSALRTRFAAWFKPQIDERPNRFVWLGTTYPFDAFTFWFKESRDGLFMVHAYRYEEGRSTFIVECSADTFARAGLASGDEDATLAYCERLFAEELKGHRLLKNRSVWRQFPTVKNARWHHDRMVLLGDAAHTAHFSIGSGTKLAMEDAIALARALTERRTVPEALAAYEDERQKAVQSTQRAAQVSLSWFESAERYLGMEPLPFAFGLLSRSLRVTHENLKLRDPAFVAQVDARFAGLAERQSGCTISRTPRGEPPPPMFTPFKLRGLLLPNRVVVSPMCMYSAEEGTIDDWHLVHLGSRAMGGAGLVMTEMTDVSAEARITPGCAGIYTAEHARAFQRVVDFVHRHTPAKIGIQLGHAGRKGATRLMWEGMDQPLEGGKWPLLSASALPYFPHSDLPKEMDRADMDRVIADFTRATSLCVEAGFDLLELHLAHGYLLASFISPLTNRRTDAYGGAIAQRMRFPLEVFDAVRAAWPAERPMSARISAADWAPGGLEPDDAVAVARMLKEHGCDIVDVSSGQTVAEARPAFGRLYQVPFSDRVRHEVGIPTMAVGAISSWADVNSVLAAERADLCCLGRAHLYDPYWTRHAARDQGFPLPWPSQYMVAQDFSPR